MALPKIPRQTDTVKLAGVAVTVRALNLTQVRVLREMDPDASDAQAIAWGCDITIEEAQEWIADSDAGVAVTLMAAIMRLSGWDEDARKSPAT